MFPQTLSLPPHFPPGFVEGTAIPRRALCASGKPYVTDSNTGQPVCLCQLQAGPTLPLPAAHGSGPGAHHSPNASPLGFHLSPFHTPRVSGHDPLPGSGLGKDVISTRSIPIGGPYTAAALAAYHPYLYAGFEPGGVRKAAVRETTGPLKSWLHEHRKNPYPTKAEKIMLAIITQMTLTQVSTWFANARRRLKKESRGSWEGCPDNDNGIDDDKDDDIGVEEKDADSTMPDHYEDLSDVSVECDEDPINAPTTSAQTGLHPAQDSCSQHPLLLLPPQAPQAPFPLKPEVTSESARRHGNGSGNQSNNAATKPRIWSISAIIGLEDKDSDGDSGSAQTRSCSDRDTADNDSGHESKAHGSLSGQCSPLSAHSPSSHC